MIRRLALLTMAACIAAGTLFSQEARPSFVVHAPQGLENAGASGEELAAVLLDALSVELDSRGVEPTRPEESGGDEAGNAAGSGAAQEPSVVHLRSRIRQDGARFIFIVRAEMGGEAVGGTTVYGVEGFSALNTVSRAMDALFPQLPLSMRPGNGTAESGSGRDGTQKRLLRRRLRFQTEIDGMHVAVAGGPELGVAEDGVLEAKYVPLVVPVEIDVKKSAPGYYSAIEQVQIDESRQSIELAPLEKAHRHMAYLSYTSGQTVGAGLGYRYFFLPDRLFLEGELYPYVQIAPELENALPVIHADLRASFGGYLSPADARWRFFLTGGFGTVATRPPGENSSWFWDHYVSVFTLGVEYNFGMLNVFLRPEAKWALGSAFWERGPVENATGPFLSLGLGWKL